MVTISASAEYLFYLDGFGYLEVFLFYMKLMMAGGEELKWNEEELDETSRVSQAQCLYIV